MRNQDLRDLHFGGQVLLAGWREVQGLDLPKDAGGTHFKNSNSRCAGPFSKHFPDTNLSNPQDDSRTCGPFYSHFRVGETEAPRDE